MGMHPTQTVASTLLAASLAAAATAPTTGSSIPVPAAEVRYFQHSGWLMCTASHLLIFDYVDSLQTRSGVMELPRELAPSLGDRGDRRVVVFISHSHADHYSPSVLSWSVEHPDIQYVVGWPLESKGQKIHAMTPHEDWSSGGMRVRTTGSTDEGVGFLVEVDGITIFHAGDHALWNAESAAAFAVEIQWLKKQQAAIDLAFLPIATGFPCEPHSSIWEGVRTATLELRPRVLVPMHVGCVDQLSLYERFREEIGPQLPDTQVVAPATRGEWFRYEGGVLRKDEQQRPAVR